MLHLVFVQRSEAELPISELRAAARRFSGLELGMARPVGDALELEVDPTAGRRRFVVGLRARACVPEDYARATTAEQAGRASGMGQLACRCPTVWEVEIAELTARAYELLAVLASVALGPILPPDTSTLLGVRSARARAEQLGRKPPPR